MSTLLTVSLRCFLPVSLLIACVFEPRMLMQTPDEWADLLLQMWQDP